MVFLQHHDSSHKKDINELVNDVKLRKSDKSKEIYDRKILESLEEQDQVPEFVIDEDFLRNSFSYQMHGVLKHLLEKVPDKFEQYFQNQTEKIPYIFMTDCEQVALLLMEKYPPETWKLPFRNQLNENILHHFISQGFQHAILYLLDNHEIFDLCLDENSAGNTPLMTMISQNESEMSLKMWDYMYEMDCFRLLGKIKHKNKSNKNILHLCTEFRQYQLLRSIVSIMTTHSVFKEEIISAFNESFPDGRKLFDRLLNEEALVQLFDIIGRENIRLDYFDIKGNNVLHRLSQMDYVDTIKSIFTETKDFIFKNLVFEKNGNGNNPLMSAAVSNSNHSLCYMLYKDAIVKLTSLENEELLHHKNNFGETLLGLVLRQ